MALLLRKRPKVRSGILRAPKREWSRHRKFVRSHMCCVPGCQSTQIDFAHLRSAANAGTSLRPHDRYGVAMCREHHTEQHNKGFETFQKKYGLDLWALAKEYVERSPDIAMKESLRGADNG